MRKWQWYFCQGWIDCTEENQKILCQIHAEPMLQPIRLVNEIGTIKGHPGKLYFTIYDCEEKYKTMIRLGPLKSEHPIYAIDGNIVPYDVTSSLFRNGKPYVKRKEIEVGTEQWVAEKGKIYKQIDGTLHETIWSITDMSKPQLEELTQTRYHWEFRGPLRWDRMRKAVHQTAEELQNTELVDMFESFDPTLEATEHGPFQFTDFLNATDNIPLSIAVAENFYAQDMNDWKPFSPSTTRRIENARVDGRQMVRITIRGHDYVLFFHSGGGESGSPPVLIRPKRYEMILSSIEDNYSRSRMNALMEELNKYVFDPRLFLVRLMTSPNAALNEHIPPEKRENILRLINDVNNMAAHVQTQIQTLLPTLLNKYKECEIRQSTTETLRPKRLPKSVRQTLVTGLRVPLGIDMEFSGLLNFIREKQCWGIKKGNEKCDICLTDDAIVLGHCGSAAACLKCWTDSLMETNMTCPFCRGKVTQCQLRIVHRKQQETAQKQQETAQKQQETSRKRKRIISFGSEQEILEQIRQTYKHIKLDDQDSMRKWFTVLMRSGVIQNGQLPQDLTKTKSLRGAIHDFNLIK